jgi:hypothetical protein
MEKRSSPMGPLRAPLGHWVIAVIFAVAVAWGVRTWLDYRAAQSEQTATLSWDAAVARQMDPSLADAAQPAVAMAQSILSDPVIADLAKSATLPSSLSAVRIGEFRARLLLRQSSANSLQVQFRDTDPDRATQTANAVATALAAGTALTGSGASATATAPAAVAPPAAPAAPMKKPVAEPTAGANDELSHSLGQLHAELSATQKKLDSLSSYTWERRQYAGEPSSYRESKQQQLLTAQVGAALKEVAGLRADPANGGAAQAPLRRIQEALLSVWPASRSDRSLRRPPDYAGFNAAGVDASRLRLERAQFADAVEIVQKEQGAVQRLEPDRASTPPASVPSAPAPSAAAPAPSESSPIAESEITKPPAEEPFRLLRPAGSPAPSPLWPVVLAGLCCGTLYLTVAGSRYRQEEEAEDYADDYSSADSQRMITPAKPMRPAGFFAGGIDTRPAETDALAAYLLDQKVPDARWAETQPALVDEQKLPLREQTQLASADEPKLPLREETQLAPADEPTLPLREETQPASADEQKLPFREEVVSDQGPGDPWVDSMMKTLSETSIGRMFETPAEQEHAENSDTESEERRLSIRPDRLAG